MRRMGSMDDCDRRVRLCGIDLICFRDQEYSDEAWCPADKIGPLPI